MYGVADRPGGEAVITVKKAAAYEAEVEVEAGCVTSIGFTPARFFLL